MENKEGKLNKLRIENEIKKMKMSLEQGTGFFSPSEKKLSPEQEGQCDIDIAVVNLCF